ncbi:MAG TPA: pyrroloquinoline quinone-dependent dehydrogenase [Steroidobacteraceae bacterium]
MLRLLASLLVASAFANAAETEWPTYGHDPGGMRFSPLEQITPANVSQLEPAWTYHLRKTKNGVQPSRFLPSQVTPLVVAGVMYLTSPYNEVIALDAATGEEIWVFDTREVGQPARRGLEYWPGDREHPPRIFFGTRDGKLVALDAKRGTAIESFGERGAVDLKTPDVMNGYPKALYAVTSPPVIYKNLVITGSMTQEQPAHGAAGDVRAWDAVTGKHVWTFHTVPRPGEFGHDTWEGDSWRNRSGVNVWGFMTVDKQRGILYMPVGAPTYDRWGGDRKGANLFSSSIVAVDANTGKYLWHFQTVHHDVWDFDTQAPPILVDVKQGRRSIPAVLIVSKTGMLYVLNRVTGEPIHPIEERPVPASDVPGEQTWPTQPFPVKPPPFARQSFSMDDVATVTPELERYCREFIAEHKMRFGGMFLPLAETPTISFPGRQGGANWGGGSFDPNLRLLFVNASNLGQVEQITKLPDGTVTNGGRATGRFSERKQRLMCQQPPWGTLTAINVDTAEIVWQSTLGVTDVLPPEVANTGRPSAGGSIATAGGLVFIAATDDNRFRAFESKTGREVWTYRLPASAHATPATYAKNGRQFVVIVATGGSLVESPIESDAVIAFALKEAKR